MVSLAKTDLWCNNFKQLYNSSDGGLSADLLRTLEMEISSEDIANLSFSSEIIKQPVGKLKRGKSDGGSMVSDSGTVVRLLDECFEVTNGVRQGGVLSPVLFAVYLDSLLDSLCLNGRGCFGEVISVECCVMEMI